MRQLLIRAPARRAYDTIRSDPRFKAVSDKLKAADASARERFRARPDLNDADIESLGM